MAEQMSAQKVMELRQSTGAGMMDCKKALIECGGDFAKATLLLRERGLAKAAKRVSRVANEGIVEGYVHLAGRVAVLVEVNSETDFVARNELFRSFAHDVALQIAAMKPTWIGPDDVPADVLEEEKRIMKKQALGEGKPEAVADRIVAGRIEKFYEERCLLRQPFVKDTERRVGDLLGDLQSKMGENIRVSRFARFEVGGPAIVAEAALSADGEE